MSRMTRSSIQVKPRLVRHPADIPIEVKADRHLTHCAHKAFNLCIKGVALRCDQSYVPGEFVEIRIPLVRPPFEAEARVIWCKTREGHFELGVEFLDQDDAYMARMVEQLCYIENYRKSMLRDEGRSLTSEQAAHEWVSKFASRFPGS